MTSQRTTAGHRVGPAARVLRIAVRGYQLIVSPWLAPRCRFYPSCSAYAVTALTRHGAVRGSWLAARRLLRCNPWNPGGVDLVPERSDRPAVGTTPVSTPDVPSPAPAEGESCGDGHPTAA